MNTQGSRLMIEELQAIEPRLYEHPPPPSSDALLLHVTEKMQKKYMYVTVKIKKMLCLAQKDS